MIDTPTYHGLQVRQATASAAASAAASLSSSDGEDAAVAGARHAFLHDFCMCIPYGALLLAGGLAGKLCGWGQPAAVMAVLGAAQVVLSNLSLRAWRAGKATTPITLSEAGKRSCAAWCPLCSVPRLAPHLPRWLLVPCLTANLIAFRTAHAPTLSLIHI